LENHCLFATGEGMTLARDLINTPANDMGPAELEAAARALAKQHGAKFRSIAGNELLKQNFPLIHAVGRAADRSRAPRLLDLRWGKDYIQKLKGRIVDGVLETQPVDRIEIPWGVTFNTSGYQVFRGMRLKLKLTPQTAEGLIAGYVDVDAFTYHLNTSWSTHHQSYGQLSSPSEYRAMRRLADGYPDPKTGLNTAISGAVTVKFAQVFARHPPEAGTLVTKN